MNKRTKITVTVVGGTLLLSMLLFFKINEQIMDKEQAITVLTTIFGYIWVWAGILVSFFIAGIAFNEFFKEMKTDEEQFMSKYRNHFKTPANFFSKSANVNKYADFKQIYNDKANFAKMIYNFLFSILIVYSCCMLLMLYFLFFETERLENASINFLQITNIVALITSTLVVLMIWLLDRILPGLKNVTATLDNSVLGSTVFVAIICISCIVLNVRGIDIIHSFNIYVGGFSTGAVAFQLIVANQTFDTKFYTKKYMFFNYLKEVNNETD